MSDDLVTPENLSKELLKSAFDAAFMETSFDKEGDLKVTEGGIRCYVFPREDRIRLMALFGAKPSASRSELLEFANNVNEEYVIVRTHIGSKDVIVFDYDIPVKGGITARAVVLATKRFLQIPIPAIRDHGDTLVE